MEAPGGMTRRAILRQSVASFIVTLPAMCFGTVVGWLAPLQESLEAGNNPVGPLSPSQLSWVSSLIYLGGLAGPPTWGRLADLIGRKSASCFIGLLALSAWSIKTFSSSVELLLTARFLLGFSLSGGFVLGPLYLSEFVHDSLRGAFGSLVIVFMNIGILFSYVLGEALSYAGFNYACLSLPILFMSFLYFLPESPLYLLSRGDTSLALSSLSWYNGGIPSPDLPKRSSAPDAPLMNIWRSLLLTLVLMTAQQWCGILVVLSFCSDMVSAPPAYIALSQLLSSLTAALLVERLGRRPLLLFSYSGMTVSLLALALPLSIPPLYPLCLYVVAYAVGAGPLPYVLMMEVLPPGARSRAASLNVFWGTLHAFASVKLYYALVSALTRQGAFGLYAAVCFSTFVYILIVVPETKGKTLEEIQKKIEKKIDDDEAAKERLAE